MARLLLPAFVSILLLPFSHASSKESDLPTKETPYKKGDFVPVTCLNRTIETGEHVIDSHGNLQYIPFPNCQETSKPLALRYLVPGPQNCTITLTDELFHLLEFYVHNDAPLTCRIPTHLSGALSSGGSASESAEAARAAIAGESSHGALGAESDRHVRMVVALGGTLQRSHLHVANVLNVVVHTSGAEKGVIDAASAYSVSPASKNTKIVIGDQMTLQMQVGWYEGDELSGKSISRGSSGSKGSSLSGWVFWLGWLFGCITGAGLNYLWLNGEYALPKSVRTFLVSRLPGKNSNVLPKYNGYGYVGSGSTGNDAFHGGVAKKD